MADPIPAADAALLAAQAKAGQAGVDAYKAAQTSLQQQRQGAVETAMREAALRGAPTGAMESQLSTMTAPYDQRIASLGQAGAAYGADMAARDRRMADYNAAVNAARSYIPQQTEQIVAPIRARGEYEVRQQQIAGDRSVAEIQANLRLTEAKMAAAAQAARIAEAKQAAKDAARDAKDKAEAAKLTQGELQSLLPAGAQARIGNLGTQLSQLIEGNKAAAIAETQGAMRANFEAQRAALTPEQQRAQQRENQAAETAWSTSRSRGSTSTQTQRAVASALNGTIGRSAVGGAGWGVFSGAGFGSQKPDYWDVLRGDASFAPAGESPAQMAAKLAAERAERNRLTAETNKRQISSIGNIFGKYRSPGVGYVTGQQLSMFDPFDAQVVTNTPGFLGNQRAVERYILGAPDDNPSFQGASDPYSVQIMRDALAKSGDELRAEGYEFDYPEFMNAIGNKGQSFYNMRAEELGQPTTEDVYKTRTAEREAAQREAEQAEEEGWDTVWNERRNAEWEATHDPVTGAPLPSAASQAGALSDQREAQLEQEFANAYGMGPPEGVSLETAYAITQNDDAYGQAEANFANTPEFQAQGFLTPDQFNTAVAKLAQSGVTLSAGARRLLRHFYVQSVGVDWESPEAEG